MMNNFRHIFVLWHECTRIILFLYKFCLHKLKKIVKLINDAFSTSHKRYTSPFLKNFLSLMYIVSQRKLSLNLSPSNVYVCIIEPNIIMKTKMCNITNKTWYEFESTQTVLFVSIFMLHPYIHINIYL